jgi:hypothetical protein
MSSKARRRQSKQVKTVCAACQERKARFRYRGEVRADRDHTLCFECYRGEVTQLTSTVSWNECASSRRRVGLRLFF